MANLKDINSVSELTEITGTEKVLLNVDGEAKQATVNLIKPAEEWDLDIDVVGTWDAENEAENVTYTMNSINTYENIKNKVLNGEPVKCKIKCTRQGFSADAPSHIESLGHVCTVAFIPAGFYDGNPDCLIFTSLGVSTAFAMSLVEDNTIPMITLDN